MRACRELRGFQIGTLSVKNPSILPLLSKNGRAFSTLLELLQSKVQRAVLTRIETAMSRFWRKKSKNPQLLLSSSLYDEETFYAAFSKDFKKAQSEVVMESPYMTRRRAKELAPLCLKLTQKGVKVRINTRNPNHHDDNLRIQACIAIKILKDAGVNIRLCNDMRHRKLAVIDKVILWEGSLNMLSHSNSREIMRRTVSRELSEQMLRFTGMNSWRS